MRDSPASAPAAPMAPAHSRTALLFVVSLMALATAGMAFVLRGDVSGVLKQTFLDPIDSLRSGGMLGEAMGMAFLGFALVIPVGSALLDILGMRPLLVLASLCFIAGTTLLELTPQGSSAFGFIYWGMFVQGLGWGLVETVINPLTMALYPADKTHKLNVLHAWWPGGIIIGGLLGLVVAGCGLGWQAKLALIYAPAVAFGAIAIAVRFPPTERKAAGIPGRVMVRECLRPMFIVWFLCMVLTAAAELAPGQWVDFALTSAVGMKGILLVVYISGLMFVMRHFAGTMAHRMSPVGVLWCSCLLAALGLFALGYAHGPFGAFLAATIWGIGVCYMWPTMLASASERFPRGGALAVGLMGCAGTLSIKFFLGRMGAIFDQVKVAAANGDSIANPALLMAQAVAGGFADMVRALGELVGLVSPQLQTASAAQQAFSALERAAATDPAAKAKLDAAIQVAKTTSFEAVAILPAVLLLVFGAIWLYDRARGGYKPESLAPAG